MNNRVLFFMIIALVSSGCAIASKDNRMESPPVLEPSLTLKFNDIPVPAGFKPQQASYSFESGGIRVGVLKYRGKPILNRSLIFIKNRCLYITGIF